MMGSPVRSPWPTILLVTGAGIVSAAQVGKAPAALAAVRADLGLDLATASWLLSSFAVVGALAGVVVGLLVDRAGARSMAVLGLLLQGLAGAAGAMAWGVPMLLATRVLEGLGFLVVTVAAPSLIVALAHPGDRGPAMAVWGTFMPVGMTLVLVVAPLLPLVGWRGFWLLNAGLLLGYAALLATVLQDQREPDRSGRNLADDLRNTLAHRGPWLLFGLFATFAAAFFAVFGFLPGLLAQRLAIGPEEASLLAGIAVAANVVGNLLCGLLLARGLRSLILLVGFSAMALLGFGILSEGVPGGAVFGLSLLVSAISGLIPVALFDAAPHHAPRSDLVGATVGFMMQGNNVGLLLGPATAGALAAAAGWPAVAMLVAALAAVASVLVIVLRASPVRPAAAG